MLLCIKCYAIYYINQLKKNLFRILILRPRIGFETSFQTWIRIRKFPRNGFGFGLVPTLGIR